MPQSRMWASCGRHLLGPGDPAPQKLNRRSSPLAISTCSVVPGRTDAVRLQVQPRLRQVLREGGVLGPVHAEAHLDSGVWVGGRRRACRRRVAPSLCEAWDMGRIWVPAQRSASAASDLRPHAPLRLASPSPGQRLGGLPRYRAFSSAQAAWARITDLVIVTQRPLQSAGPAFCDPVAVGRARCRRCAACPATSRASATSRSNALAERRLARWPSIASSGVQAVQLLAASSKRIGTRGMFVANETFHGQTSWQTSQPKIQSSVVPRRRSGRHRMPRCSIVQ